MDVNGILRWLLAEPAFSSEDCATNRRLLTAPVNRLVESFWPYTLAKVTPRSLSMEYRSNFDARTYTVYLITTVRNKNHKKSPKNRALVCRLVFATKLILHAQ